MAIKCGLNYLYSGDPAPSAGLVIPGLTRNPGKVLAFQHAPSQMTVQSLWGRMATPCCCGDVTNSDAACIGGECNDVLAGEMFEEGNERLYLCVS